MKKTKGTYSIFNNVIYLFRAIIAVYPVLFVMILAEMVLSMVTPLIGIYLPSLAVRLVTEQADKQKILLIIGGLGLILMALRGINNMASKGKYFLYNAMRRYFMEKIFVHFMYCDYIHIESKEGQTKYQKARNSLLYGDMSGTSRMVVSSVELVATVLSFVIYSGILTTLHPLVVVILVALSVLNLVMTKNAKNYEAQQKDRIAGYSQKLSYISERAKDVHYGKDVRLYDMEAWFVDMQETLLRARAKLQGEVQNRYFGISCVNSLTRLLRDGLIYGFLIYRVLKGAIGVDAFVLYLGAITGFAGFIETIVMHYNELGQANMSMNDLRAFLDTTNEPDPENPAELPQNGEVSIDFRHVWFSYEKGEEPVIKDLCLHVGAGEKIALVGVNGAGKTTLVKLLMGLYKPDKGNILINGTDITQFRKQDLFELFSAVFQDLYIAPHTVAENVSMKPEEETDMERVESCLEKAGLLEKMQTYAKGIHTDMTKKVSNGIILSGGQQQKLLMARALYKDASVMILDEPTAALDPIAESETYESFHKLTANKTVLYISHRLASTRFCDRIAFLQEGKITENGSHEELMRKAGAYAKMFEVQSHYYQKGSAEDEKEAE